MQINHLPGLNRAARAFCLNNHVSKRNSPVYAVGFTGYINGDPVKNATIERTGKGYWIVRSTEERILSLKGDIINFAMWWEKIND